MKNKHTSPWAWIPTLYFAQGLPYVAVMTISVIMYKRLGISNTELAFYTGWLNLPWVIKPLWSPFIDLIKTKRWWIVTMQLLMGAGLAGLGLTLPPPPCKHSLHHPHRTLFPTYVGNFLVVGIQLCHA